MEKEFKTLDLKVYPSSENSISVEEEEIYGGAHLYRVKNCKGFIEGKTEYDSFNCMDLQFVKKNDDGTIIPGLQSEQLVLILLDRTKKLNDRFPSEQYSAMKKGLIMFLDACKERVEYRIDRGVMGELKK